MEDACGVSRRAIVRRAFVASLPVMTGYTTMGAAAGMLLALHAGVAWSGLWAALTSGTFISGLLQFLLVDWVRSGTAFADVAVLAVCLNIRYSLYGLSLLERFKAAPLGARLYMIGTVTDETYALQVQCPWPPGPASTLYCLALAACDHAYWVLGVTAGALAGSAVTFDARGVDFAMTALFIVILVDMVRDRANRAGALVGGVSAVVATGLTYWLFGSWKMVLPSMALIVAAFWALRPRLDPERRRLADGR